MNNGEIVSLLINLLVGVYFAYYYPRSVRRKLGGGQLPPAFTLLLRVIPPLGYLLIAGSLLYAGYRMLS